MQQCEPASSRAWLDRARLQPHMAGRRTCISARPPPAMHGVIARVSSHAWLDGEHTSVRAMHGSIARVASHTWLDGERASV